MAIDHGEGRRLRVLFVDDEASLVALARYTLERSGWDVVAAHDGHEALAILERDHNTIDVIVLDPILPDVSGDQLLDRMQEIDDTVPVVVASRLEAGRVADILGRRTAQFVHKPYSLVALPCSLNEALGQAAAVRQRASYPVAHADLA